MLAPLSQFPAPPIAGSLRISAVGLRDQLVNEHFSEIARSGCFAEIIRR